MSVFRTVTIENSAATKKRSASTSANSPASRHIVAASECSMAEILCFSVGEEVRVDEAVDHLLVGRLDLLELNAHADAAVAPRDAPLGVDVLLGPRHAEADLDPCARLERAGRADRDAAVTEVQRQRRRDRVAEAVLDRNPEHDARAAAAGVGVPETGRRGRARNERDRAWAGTAGRPS